MDKISPPTLKGHSAGSRRKLKRQCHRLSSRPAGFDTILSFSTLDLTPALLPSAYYMCLGLFIQKTRGRISACTVRVGARKGTFLSFVFPSSWWVHFLDSYVALWRKLASWWHLSPHQQASRFGLIFCWWLNHFLSTSSFTLSWYVSLGFLRYLYLFHFLLCSGEFLREERSRNILLHHLEMGT